MKPLLLLTLFPLLLFAAPLADDPNAKAVDACKTVNKQLELSAHAVPYVPILNWGYHMGMYEIGFIRKQHLREAIMQGKAELEMAFFVLFDQLNTLEDLVNDRFNELEGFVDRKQFETDITDPATILWDETLAFLDNETSSVETLTMLESECNQRIPWKIAKKIYNRLYGPDNTLMTQVKANKWSNVSFMHTKDMLMYRMFQMMSVQAICLGIQHGENYDLTQDWEMKRIGTIYDSVVRNIISMREQQEEQYFDAMIREVSRESIDAGGSNIDIMLRLSGLLNERYPWDSFYVEVSNRGCDNRHGFYANNTGRTRGFADWWSPGWNKAVKIARYWPRQLTDDEVSRFSARLSGGIISHDFDATEYANWKGLSDPSSVALATTWFDSCSVDAHCNIGMNPAVGMIFVYAWYYDRQHHHGTQEIFSAPERPNNVPYDLGFWIR